jgi:hypothetical protein
MPSSSPNKRDTIGHPPQQPHVEATIHGYPNCSQLRGDAPKEEEDATTSSSPDQEDLRSLQRPWEKKEHNPKKTPSRKLVMPMGITVVGSDKGQRLGILPEISTPHVTRLGRLQAAGQPPCRSQTRPSLATDLPCRVPRTAIRPATAERRRILSLHPHCMTAPRATAHLQVDHDGGTRSRALDLVEPVPDPYIAGWMSHLQPASSTSLTDRRRRLFARSRTDESTTTTT